jgi:hypothetical protein
LNASSAALFASNGFRSATQIVTRNDRLVPTQPHRNARRMSHLIHYYGRRSACPTIQFCQPRNCRATCILRNCRQVLRRRLVKVPGQLKLANPTYRIGKKLRLRARRWRRPRPRDRLAAPVFNGQHRWAGALASVESLRTA